MKCLKNYYCKCLYINAKNRRNFVYFFLTNYDKKSPSFREGMNNHPYYFFANILFFLKKTKYFRKKYNFF